ncbi:MAG: shikimate dehydrogenase, partial [Opitutales bacterium]
MDPAEPNPPAASGACPDAGATLTMDEVRRADFSGITPLAVLGWPIRHSVSPQMHNAALAVMAKDDPRFDSWRYYRVEVPPDQLEEALTLLAAKGFRGLNLTIPHKVEALRYAAKVHPMAMLSGAVNTLKLQDGVWTGFNTDGTGLELAVRGEPLNDLLHDRDVVMLGAGGAARAIGAICLMSHCRSLWIGNRSADRLAELVDKLRHVDKDGRMRSFDLTQAATAGLPKDALIINATSLGLKSTDPSPIHLSIFTDKAAVFDTTYGRHASALLMEAATRHIRASNGLPMLVWQGAAALRIWTDFESGLPMAAVSRMFTA